MKASTVDSSHETRACDGEAPGVLSDLGPVPGAIAMAVACDRARVHVRAHARRTPEPEREPGPADDAELAASRVVADLARRTGAAPPVLVAARDAEDVPFPDAAISGAVAGLDAWTRLHGPVPDPMAHEALHAALARTGRPLPMAGLRAARDGGIGYCGRRFPPLVLGGDPAPAWRVVLVQWRDRIGPWRRGLRDRVHSFRAAEDAGLMAAFALALERRDEATLRSIPPSESVVAAAGTALPALHPLVSTALDGGALHVWLPGMHDALAVLVGDEDAARRAGEALEVVVRAHALPAEIRRVPLLARTPRGVPNEPGIP